ncbi:MAG: MATE family efflux transporter [Clostridia bacterium]|nr:MATE family efflux transporter [Clostridia bacterium]
MDEQVRSVKKVSSPREIDMTSGNLFPKILAFSLPLMATGILQLLFTAADMMVVGKYVGDVALAAVGATNSLVTLLVNFFIGLSLGAGVMMSKHYGAKDANSASKLLHTAMPVSLISGILVTFVGLFYSKDLLLLMKTPEECLPLSIEYLSIYFLGSPFNLVFNFGAAMQRATGDTVRPLIFLTIGGVLNVIVNLISVIAFNLGVVGVAYATITSQAVSAVLVVVSLIRSNGFIRLNLKKLAIKKTPLLNILKIGLPSGLQASLFSISNVIIQSTINEFGQIVVAGNTAAVGIEGFVYTVMNSISQSAVTAIGQNYGAGDYTRIKQAIKKCLLFVVAAGLGAGILLFLLKKPLISLYTSSAQSAQVAYSRMTVILLTYFLLGIMDVFNNGMRGMGVSVLPMIIVLVGTCALRVAWIYIIFPLKPEYLSVVLSYPVSWLITSIVGVVAFSIVYRMRKKQFLNNQQV